MSYKTQNEYLNHILQESFVDPHDKIVISIVDDDYANGNCQLFLDIAHTLVKSGLLEAVYWGTRPNQKVIDGSYYDLSQSYGFRFSPENIDCVINAFRLGIINSKTYSCPFCGQDKVIANRAKDGEIEIVYEEHEGHVPLSEVEKTMITRPGYIDFECTSCGKQQNLSINPPNNLSDLLSRMVIS